MGKKLYVGNLPFSATDDSLRSIFEQVGQVDSAKVITDRDTGRSKGFGFVEMATDEECAEAIKKFNGTDYEGRALTVNEARPMVPPPPPQRLRVGGNVAQASLLTQVKPVYPPLAKQARIQGVVLLEAVISKDGAIDNLRVISGHPLLTQAAIDAVKQWRYKPTLLNGEPVEVVTTITVNFAFSQ